MAKFEDFKLNKQILNAIADEGFEKPTPIQAKVIPLITGGHDVIGVAQTGTGKTAAYSLPILMKLKFSQSNAPRAMILVPTRELAIQIMEDIRRLAQYTDLKIEAVYGGKGIKHQIELIMKGVDILIATPGRFWDIYLSGELKTKEIKTMVLDEADRMMDMGFVGQIRRILEVIPRKRQNLLFSATMPDKVKTFCDEFLTFPDKVEITPQSTPSENVRQTKILVPNFKTKLNFLLTLLKKDEWERIIVFVKTKQSANNIFKFLQRKDVGTVKVIHSNKDQNSRINAIKEFKKGSLRILVSTDLASRGIDVSMVTHVVNFDVPLVYEEYVHRIGRTGRAEATGEALTFVTPADEYHIKRIEKIIRSEIPQAILPQDVKIEETPYEEMQLMNREIDKQRKKENPGYQGAFHEKKKKGSHGKKKKGRK